MRRGALNFDTEAEVKIINDKGMPADIMIHERGIAERMIESFMLAANETVAEHFAKRKLPFIYRIHEDPKAEKITEIPLITQVFLEYTMVQLIKLASKLCKIS